MHSTIDQKMLNKIYYEIYIWFLLKFQNCFKLTDKNHATYTFDYFLKKIKRV